jgi:hypothetical protein
MSPQLSDLLKDLLSKKVIEPCRGNPRFIANIFTVPKPSGGARLILDLSPLNLFLKPASFQLPSIKQLRAALLRPAWLAKVDLRDAYWHVPIDPAFRSYLAFRWHNQMFEFRAMPFGFSTAPAAFTSLMNFPLTLLREKGVSCLVYLDDWIVWAESSEECLWALQQSLQVLSSLGFIINVEKSVLVPSRVLCWLGVEIDALSLRWWLPLPAVEGIIRKSPRCFLLGWDREDR